MPVIPFPGRGNRSFADAKPGPSCQPCAKIAPAFGKPGEFLEPHFLTLDPTGQSMPHEGLLSNLEVLDVNLFNYGNGFGKAFLDDALIQFDPQTGLIGQ